MFYFFILHFTDKNSSRVFETGSFGLAETQLMIEYEVNRRLHIDY